MDRIQMARELFRKLEKQPVNNAEDQQRKILVQQKLLEIRCN